MLYLYYGTDGVRVRSEALKKARAVCAPGAEVISISPSAEGEASLHDALGTTSLFWPHEVFLLDTLREDEALFHTMLELIPRLKESVNHFIVLEGHLPPTVVKQYASAGIEIVEYTRDEEEYNPFGLADALLARDKKQLWIRYCEGVRQGLTGEEMIGTLLWQLKVLRLVAKGLTPEAAGLKPFVHGKAKRALGAFREGEPTELAQSLVRIYHEGHRGEVVLGDALEAWILRL